MYVLTMDQKGSRRGGDLVGEGLRTFTALAGAGVARPFQRTAGDEIQAVLTGAASVVEVMLHAARDGRWSAGLGVGPVEQPMPEETRAGRGPAFEHARDAVTRAKRAPGGVACTAEHPDAEHVEAVLQLLAELDHRRTDSSQQVGELIAEGRTQTEVAEQLGVSQQAVSRALDRGLWHQTRRVASLAVQMLETMHEEVTA